MSTISDDLPFKPLIGPRLRRWIVETAAVLILSGMGIILCLGFGLAILPQPQVRWVWLPYHEWRFRIMTAEDGAIAIRTYFGFWFDMRFSLIGIAAQMTLVGYMLLLALLPDRIHREFLEQREARRRDLLLRGLCPRCKYNLTGNTSGVCPECGTNVKST